MSRRTAWRVVALGVLAGGATACGLKGSLEMPEKSTSIVIRGPQQPPAGTGTAAPAGAPPGTAQPAQPVTPPSTTAPKDDRLPPPPLPGGNPGSARGG